MSRPRRTEEVEITLSFRFHDCAGTCVFATATIVRSDGARSVLASRHLTGEPLVLVDRANEYVRDLELEHFLPLTSPF
jgi:hypothetical protein